MNKYVLLLLLLLLPVSFSDAYTPWNEDDTEYDVSSSDVILIGRVTKLERLPMNPIYQEKNSFYFDCIATVSVGKILKGKEKLDGRQKIEIYMGTSAFYSKKGVNERELIEYEAEPSYMFLANTQANYDLRFNEVYLLFLNKRSRDYMPTVFEPRTGPYSIGWIKKEEFTKKAGDGSNIRFSKKFISMGIGGQKWKKEVPLDEYLKDQGLAE